MREGMKVDNQRILILKSMKFFRFPEGQDFFADTFRTPPYNVDLDSGINNKV